MFHGYGYYYCCGGRRSPPPTPPRPIWSPCRPAMPKSALNSACPGTYPLLSGTWVNFGIPSIGFRTKCTDHRSFRDLAAILIVGKKATPLSANAGMWKRGSSESPVWTLRRTNSNNTRGAAPKALRKKPFMCQYRACQINIASVFRRLKNKRKKKMTVWRPIACNWVFIYGCSRQCNGPCRMWNWGVVAPGSRNRSGTTLAPFDGSF
jgi:hypothetical protein